MKVNWKLRLISLFILQLFIQNSFAQQSGSRPPEVFYKVDWNERLAPNLGLKAHTDTLLGDQVDLHTGRLSFEHVDVSLPGNSDLPVEIRRRLNPSQPNGNAFADWQLEVPRISTNINGYEFSSGIRWGKKRCSEPLINSIPESNSPKSLDRYAQPLRPHQYSNGVNLDVPNIVSTAILDKTTSASWPANAAKVTAKNWYFTCITNIDGAGTEGFYAHSPNGDRYRFDKIQSKRVSQTDLWQVITINQVAYSLEQTYMDMLVATEVTDVNGNWVRYTYDSLSRLTRIHSNDGRRIDLEYTGTQGAHVKSVIANPGTSDELRWNYTYGYKNVLEWVPPAVAYDAPGKSWKSYYSLTSTTLPDGRSWQFDLAGLRAKPIPGVSYEYRTYNGGSRQLSGIYSECKQEAQLVSLTHPDGVKGEYEIEERSRFLPFYANGPSGSPCPKTRAGGNYNTHQDLMAIVKKKISAPGIPTASWTYSYANGYDGAANANPDGINKTYILRPDGSKSVNYYTTSSSEASSPTTTFSLVSHIKRELYENASATSPMEKVEYSYLHEQAAGSTYVFGTVDNYRPVRETDVKITRGTDVYKTRYTYNIDREVESLFFGYSYGYPTKIEQWSSLGGGTRTTDIMYMKDSDDWILGLTVKVTKNGKAFDEYNYDTKGRIVGYKRLGIHVASMRHHSTGTQAGKLSSYREIWGRVTSFSNYHRGIPRTITRADNSQFIRSVDNNGHITQETNWRGVTTNYQYNKAGHLILIDRPSPWTDTQIEYDYNGSGVLQTLKKGGEQITTNYDAMLRPTQIYRLDLSHSNHVYTEIKYDAMGRERFTSLPSEYSDSNIGVEKYYDALGRVIQSRETASNDATYYEYLAGNKIRIRDPMNNTRIDTSSGFGNPYDGNLVKIEKPHGITADFTYDIFGNILSMSQTKSDGSKLESNYTYDSALRLCRMRVPERGDTLYAYNQANEFVGYAEGQAAGVGCATLPSSTSVVLSYDNLKRLTTTDYPGATPDITRTYDANDNILTLNRAGVNWTYTYNTIDLPISETLSIDGRNYKTTSVYDNNAVLTAKTYPSGRQYTFANDGLGRPTHIAYGTTKYLNNITYHPNGKVNTLARGNGGVYEQHLNDRQLTSYIGGNWGDKRYYYYDANRRITSINSISYDVYDREFGYDDAGRLSSATGPWGTASYQYDALSNITKKIEGSRIVDIHYNTANRIADVRDSAAGNVSRNFHHDARGNVTNDGRHSFVYDYSNQPISISGAMTGAYTYDGHLKRVKQMINGEIIYSVYDKSGTLLTRENVTNNEKTDYISLTGQTFVRIKNGLAIYPLNDHLGTALMEADQNGNVPATQVYNYTPWGETINAVPFGTQGNDPGNRNEQGFAGHIDDATGLVYMQARFYDPVVGRFLSADPIGYSDQLNLYAYVYNDPVNFTDPTGKAGNSLGVWLGTYLETGDTKKANAAIKASIDLHGKASMEVLSTMTRIGLAVDVVEIGLEVTNGNSADDEVTGVLAGEGVAKVTEEALDGKIGADAAEVVGAIAGSIVGKIVEEKVEETIQEIETPPQEDVERDKSTDRR